MLILEYTSITRAYLDILYVCDHIYLNEGKLDLFEARPGPTDWEAVH